MGSLTSDARPSSYSGCSLATRVNNYNAFEYSVLTQVTRRLQIALNATTRLLVGAGKFDHVTPVLRDVLHWLPVPH